MTSQTPSGFVVPVDALSHSQSLLSNSRVQLVGIVLVAPVVTLFLWFFVSYHTSPLKKYPGPFLAGRSTPNPRIISTLVADNEGKGWTNLWRLYQAYSAQYAPRMKKLHEKYGPVVRLGPNLLDIDYPELSKVVYGTDGKWRKVSRNQSISRLVSTMGLRRVLELTAYIFCLVRLLQEQ